MKIIKTILFVLLAVSGFSQTNVIDSLEQLIPTLKEDTNKVKALNGLAAAYYNVNAVKTLDYATRAMLLADQFNYQKGVMESFKMLGVGYWIKGEIQEALMNYEKSLEIATLLDSKRDIASLNNNMAVVHTDQGEYYVALQLFFNGLKAVEEGGYDDLFIIFNQNIGDTYKNLNDVDNAIKYTQIALNSAKEADNKRSVAVCNNNMGEIFMLDGNEKLALERFLEARGLFQDLGNKRGVSITTSNIGDVYFLLKRFSEAQSELLIALELFKELGNQDGEANTLIQLGRLYLEQKKYDQAPNYLNNALLIAEDAGLLEVKKNALKALSNYYRNTGQFKIALEYLERHEIIKDSLFNLYKNRQVVELQTLYESEKKERENILLREDQLRKDEQLNKQSSQQRMLLAFLIVTTLFVIVLIYSIIQSYKANKKLKTLNNVVLERNEEIQAQSEELNEAYEEIKTINSNLEKTVLSRTEKLNRSNAELSEFLYRASHDLKGPIMTLQGLAYLGSRDGERNYKDIIDRVSKTADEMNSTLNNLLHVNVVRKSDLANQEIDFNRIINKVVNPKERLISEKGIKVIINVSIDGTYVSDPDLLGIIFENLISNGIQYSDPNKIDKKVEITINSVASFVQVHISDNGVGIEEDQLEKIFEMFYRGNIHSHGNGLGLYITKVAVESLNGKIEINSEVGVGTDVKMVFPIGKE
ncbi:MAG: tetratricopeptide repeat-containing sensor histidine kinase [Fulvivirga sp.]|uniref:tetratricopeptide repeat-containing sensor histidine kinase n=1 Tax=Fulvivirga sp. TaxID=1931237 RepID=UPI0032ED4C5E